MVSLSVFAGSEQIRRRFSIFAEDPCKSTITTSEPCSPVFKEAQPRPSEHSQLKFQPFIKSNLKTVHNVFYCELFIVVIKDPNRLCKTKGISVFWISLSPKVSRLSAYTHAHSNIHELQEPSTHSHKLPFIGGESDVPWKEGKILDYQ